MDISFETLFCTGKINKITNNDITVIGEIKDYVKDGQIYYIAASPADHHASYAGSGLPFYNQIQAFDNTPNKGSIKLDSNNTFKIDLILPNSYMVGLGSVIIPPTMYIKYINKNNIKKIINIKLSEGIPFRHLTYPSGSKPRANVTFYDSQFNLPIRGQEQILIDSQYPKTNETPNNYWGLKPPM